MKLDYLRLFFVKPMKEWNTYYCIYGMEFDELWIAMNNMQKNWKVCTHQSGQCPPSFQTFDGLMSLWESMVCFKGEVVELHQLKCLMEECQRCGNDNMDLYEYKVERLSPNLVEWRQYALEETISKKSKPLKQLILQYKKDTFWWTNWTFQAKASVSCNTKFHSLLVGQKFQGKLKIFS